MKLTQEQLYHPSFESFIQTVILDIIQQKTKGTLSGHILRNYDLKVHLDTFTDNLVASITAYTLGERQNPYIYETYETWWDHLKDTIRPKLPDWLKKKVLVRKKKHELNVTAIYPLLNISIPKNRHNNKVTILIDNQPIGSLPDVDNRPVKVRHHL